MKRCAVLERSFCFRKFLVGCGRVVSRAGRLGRDGFGIKLVKTFRADIGPAYKFFLQRRILVASYW